jgi:predicted kinase
MSSNKPRLVILRGLPASGKTTWAKAWVAQDRPNRVRVNKDDLRAMVDNGVFIEGVTELRVVAARDILVKGLMARGLSVVVDDTNLRNFHVRKLAKLAHEGCWEWEIQNFDTDVDDCCKRDLLRKGNDYVGSSVIHDMHNKYIANGALNYIPSADELSAPIEPGDNMYIPDKTKPAAVIIDVDGTVALKGTRDPFDESRVSEDAPNQRVIDIVKADVALHDLYPIFVSGRSTGCAYETIDWLEKYVFPDGGFSIFMRKEGDNRPDYEIKLEIFDQFIRSQYNVVGVYDDRNQVVAMWRSIGIPAVLQVAEGAF